MFKPKWGDQVSGWKGGSIFMIVISSFFLMGMGERYSEQGRALGKAVYEELIRQRFCTDFSDCQKKKPMYGENGDRVRLNLYGIQDRELLSKVFSMVAKDGMGITNGAPITLSAFPGQKADYLGLGFRNIFNLYEPIMRLEINK